MTIDPYDSPDGEEQRLFLPDDAVDPAYRSLRDLPHLRKWRDFCEELWHRYALYADPHFLSEVRHQFHQRFWEMYLAVTLLSRGFALHKFSTAGPEFGIDIAGPRYWLEAIAPTGGTGADAVTEPQLGVAGAVPVDQIILRLTSALSTKHEKHGRDLLAGLVLGEDGFIVAINGRQIPHCVYGSDMPYIVKALYGVGNLVPTIDKRTRKVTDAKLQHRAAIPKASGVMVSSQSFVAEECPELSAVLFSNIGVDGAGLPLGVDFYVLHNLGAKVPLPRGALRFAREYWREGNSVVMQNYAQAEYAGSIDDDYNP